jgi:hypothetical protein
MGIVFSRLRDSGIKPEMFDELRDKEYAHDTIDLIRSNGKRLLAQLSADEQTEVQDIVTTADRYTKYGYYVENFQDGQKLIKAYKDVKSLEWRQGCGGCLLALIAAFIVVPFIMSFVITGMFVAFGALLSIFGNNLDPNTMTTVTMVMASITMFAGIPMAYFWRGSSRYQTAKKTIAILEPKINLDRFVMIDKRTKGSKAHAEKIYRHCQAKLEKFFGQASNMLLK